MIGEATGVASADTPVAVWTLPGVVSFHSWRRFVPHLRSWPRMNTRESYSLRVLPSVFATS